MIHLHDEDRDPLQVWKRSLPEDEEQPTEEQVVHGKMFTKALAWIGAGISLAAFWIFVIKQWLGL